MRLASAACRVIFYNAIYAALTEPAQNGKELPKG